MSHIVSIIQAANNHQWNPKHLADVICMCSLGASMFLNERKFVGPMVAFPQSASYNIGFRLDQ